MTKEDLKEYHIISESLKEIKEKIIKIENYIEELKSVGEEAHILVIESLDRLQDAYLIKLRDMAEKQLIIENAIAELPERDQRLMRLRYIDFMTWEDIADKMYYSYQHIHRLHNEALRMLKVG